MTAPKHPATRCSGGPGQQLGQGLWVGSHSYQGHRVHPMGSTVCSTPLTSPAPTIQVTLDPPNPPPCGLLGHPLAVQALQLLCRWSSSRTAPGPHCSMGALVQLPKRALSSISLISLASFPHLTVEFRSLGVTLKKPFLNFRSAC